MQKKGDMFPGVQIPKSQGRGNSAGRPAAWLWQSTPYLQDAGELGIANPRMFYGPLVWALTCFVD